MSMDLKQIPQLFLLKDERIQNHMLNANNVLLEACERKMSWDRSLLILFKCLF